MKKILILSLILSHFAFGQTDLNMNEKEKQLQLVLDKTVDQKKVFGATFSIQQGQQLWTGAAGNIEKQKPYFIASTTKLFTTAIIYQLISEQKIALEDHIITFFKNHEIDSLHVYKGKDYTPTITIKHLLAHSSGLPDYFQDKGDNGKSLEDEIVEGHDQYWTFEEVIQKSRNLPPLFPPGYKQKAHYSDCNFQLLGKIIELVTGESYAQNCQTRIIQPLGLTQTYLYTDSTDQTPTPMHYKSGILNIPKAMVAFGPDGGMVSTTEDMISFTKGFFEGKLFPKSYIPEMQEWRKIFYPLKSGVGIHLFKLPWIFNPTGALPYFIGHSGLSGALAFYCPEKDLYISGTVNQIAYPEISFKTMVKLTAIYLKSS